MSATVRGSFVVTLCLLVALAVRADPAPAAPAPSPSLALHADVSLFPIGGSWVLNTKLSDDPTTAVPKSAPRRDEGERDTSGGERGGGGEGGWGGHGGHGGRGGRPASGQRPSESDRAATDAAMDLMREMPETIVVARHEDSIQIVEAGGRMTNWKLDGKPHLDDRFGTTLEGTARWDGKTLDAETPMGSSGAFTETYAVVLLGDGKKLLQVTRTLKVFRGGHVVSVRRVYEPAP